MRLLRWIAESLTRIAQRAARVPSPPGALCYVVARPPTARRVLPRARPGGRD